MLNQTCEPKVSRSSIVHKCSCGSEISIELPNQYGNETMIAKLLYRYDLWIATHSEHIRKG